MGSHSAILAWGYDGGQECARGLHWMPATAAGWRRWWQIATARKSMYGGRGSCCWRPTVWAPAGSCGKAERAGTRSTAGASVSKPRASMETRPGPRVPPLPEAVRERTVALTLTDPPGETTHW